MFAQKVLPGGARLKSALALVALGVWLAIAPSSVPDFQEPGKMDEEIAQQR